MNTENYKGYSIKIEQDDNVESPREWENLGKMVCWHRRYNLGDENEFRSPDDFHEWYKENKEDVLIMLPLFLYDHSGISMSTSKSYPYNDMWDAGQVGYIYALKSAVRKEWKVKHISPRIKKIVLDNLKSEVKVYDQFLTGDVYGYIIENPEDEDETLDSCWSFYGYDECLKEAQSTVDYYVQHDQKEQAELDTRLAMVCAV